MAGKRMIEGVELKRLTSHADERGHLTELLRRDDAIFDGFGQCYYSVSYPGVIRGWHYHRKQTDYFACLVGMTVWEFKSPGGAPRHGILGLDTTRGDRLFITLLGSAYIFLAWLAFFGTPLWIPLIIALAYGFVIFRWA